jgi:hypothetical protein
MVQAGKLQSIEEALAGLSGASSGASPGPARPKSAGPPQHTVSSTPPKNTPQTSSPEPAASGGDLRAALHSALLAAKLTHVADAVEHSTLAESPTELVFTTPKMYQLYLKQPELEAIARKITGRPVRVTVKIGEPAPAPVAAPVSANAREDEAASRALSHPEVKRFQEMFPDSQVRTVRNLKEN